MNPVKKQYICIAAVLLALLFSLSGCKDATQQPPASTAAPTAATEENVEETTSPTVPKELVEELTVVVTAGDIYRLNHYPNLKTVDLTGSTCYDAILDYMEQHPQVAVTYTVSLGNISVSNAASSITLSPGEFDHALLLENLQYLPQLSTIILPDVSLDAQQINAIREAYPELTLEYTVNLLGSTYDLNTTNLDLSGMSSGQVEEAVSKLGLLPNLTDVQLNNNLSMADVARLQDSNPNATFHYSFTLFGKTLSTTTETVEYKNQNIGNEGETQIRQALAILDNCSRFLLDNCKIDFEILAAIREDFRDGPNVVWRVYFGKNYRYTALTDQETIRAVYNVTDDTIDGLQYCEGCRFMDIGHNEYLTDLSFVGHMPNIEVLIVAGSAVRELVGFENCKKLTWLELAYCYKLENIDSLAGCESLTYLNLSHTNVSNFMPLDGLPLQRFVCLRPRASTEEQNIFVQIHTDCLTVFYGYSNPYGYGWRYDDNGNTFNEYYKNVVREAFNYDYLETLLPQDD